MRKTTGIIVKTIVLAGLLLSLTVFLQANDNCVTAECHQTFKSLKRLHFPAGDNCTRCHEKTGKHKFSLVDQVKTCFQCHDENRNRKHVHDAISSSDCAACHNPHGGDYKAYLKTARIDTICLECHDKEPMSKKVVHAPLRSGDCTGCHNAHSSDYPALLTAKKESFCIQCHKDKDFSKPQPISASEVAKNKGKKKFQKVLIKSKENLKVHTVLQEGCDGCHSPHSSDYKSLLIAAPGRICGSCHEDIAEKVNTVKVKHPTLERRKKCMNCHDPHASTVEFNLVKAQVDLCLGCHNKPIANTSQWGYNLSRIMKNNPDKHQPFAEDKCSVCHDPHGSDFFRILNDFYPRRFYSPFDVNHYKICFRCHDSALVTTKVTSQATGFRDGRKNLHYIHVNLEKGRTCRACHEVHAGKGVKLIRDYVPFGKWKLPINFSKTKPGGSCTPGCHKTLTYNREIKSEPVNKRTNQ
jgi:predicted CXXCH cytochrome family protein